MDFINATVTLKEYNKNHNSSKCFGEFFSNNGTKNIIQLICTKHKTPRAYRTTRGKYGSTMMHPELFEYFGRWLYKLPNQTFTRDEFEFCASIEEAFKGVLKFERQKLFDGYFVDLYCAKLNLCIEFDEDHHSLNANKTNDIKRQNEIESKYGCKFLRHSKKKNTVFETINSIITFKNLYI